MEDKLVYYLDQAEKFITENAGDALDLALFVARIDALQSLVLALAGLATGLAIHWFISMKLYSKYKANNDDDIMPLVIIPALISTITIVTSIVYLLNIFMWVGLFRPEVWIIHKALAS